jgi:hypothetical protein
MVLVIPHVLQNDLSMIDLKTRYCTIIMLLFCSLCLFPIMIREISVQPLFFVMYICVTAFDSKVCMI